MNEVLARLDRIYRQQLEIYDRVLELADEALRLARAGRPLCELNALLSKKQRLLSEIDRLDGLAAPDRAWFREHERSATETSQLRLPVAETKRRIEDILAREREMERWILLRRESDDELLADTGAGD